MKKIATWFITLLAVSILCFQAVAQSPSLHGSALEKYQINQDTVGWLQIPGTDIDNVILQNTSDTNQYYLRRDFEGNYDLDGSYFADYRCAFGTGIQSLGRNTVIYGNSTTDNPEGALFSQLNKYRDENFAKENPYLYFATTEETYTWEVFAVSVSDVSVPCNRPDLEDSELDQAIETVRASCLHPDMQGISVGSQDKILTLYTSDYSTDAQYPNNHRLVIMARLVETESGVQQDAWDNPGMGRSKTAI